jgi:enoyl-CoA hydratase/carnithine racemase
MTDSGRIGLNEVELGIPVPKFWALLMGRTIGTGVADKLCGFAQMCTPQRALELGMIDEVAAGGQLMQVRNSLDWISCVCDASNTLQNILQSKLNERCMTQELHVVILTGCADWIDTLLANTLALFSQAAEAAMTSMLKLPDVGRITTKQQLRSDFVDSWRKYYAIEAEIGFTQLQLPATVEALGVVRDRLSGGAARSRM